MKCKNHPEENGVNTCNECGCWLCERCTFERTGRLFCPSCAAQQVGSDGPVEAEPLCYSQRKSWGLLFLFSVIIPLPGLNYMYLGLIKRGLVAMSALFGIIYMAIILNGGLTALFVFAIPVLILTCIFDGFKLLSRINAGEEVSDNIDDITSFIRRNRVAITGFLLILLAINIVGGVLPWVVRTLRNVIPILIAIWAIHALFRKKPPSI